MICKLAFVLGMSHPLAAMIIARILFRFTFQFDFVVVIIVAVNFGFILNQIRDFQPFRIDTFFVTCLVGFKVVFGFIVRIIELDPVSVSVFIE